MRVLWKWTKRVLISLLIVIGFMVIAVAILLQQPQFGAPPQGNHLAKLKASIQHTGDKFQNPEGLTTAMSLGKGLSLLPQMLSDEGEKLPSKTLPMELRQSSDFGGLSESETRVTWLGHSSFILEINGLTLLLDPMLGPQASPVSFMAERFPDILPISAEDLPAVDAVLFSHDHYDHLDYPTILAIKDKVKHFYVPLGLGAHLQHWGVSSENITELDWWEEASFEGLKLACTPSQHFSGRGLADRDQTLWCSWVIEGKAGKVFFSGDSGYFGGFKKIGEKYGPFDLTLLECGQYNLLWTEIHMLPEQTLQAHLDLKGEILIPIHWGAFQLSLHDWYEPVERLTAAAAKYSAVELATPIIGQSFKLNTTPPQKRWWKSYIKE